ncbi:hypothetical protein J5N97_002570 [Dioscorea zingiberensis]|uniref:Uncharacterized protein n=1 Tax=Dioscorea zingiberensis TaxID=325984 RepID=A0A9D5HPI5_9LILI|nr:hypothetical protein J5N97_002570 [Dioscorea zingiberensis]
MGSQSDGPFEFYFDARSAAGSCAADDVFLAGKLLPFRPPASPQTTRRLEQPITRLFDGKFTASYQKLRKTSPTPSTAKTQPTWRILAFAPGSAPAKMEMREIRSRQRRRGSPPPTEMTPGPWKLLQSLSCKAVELSM